MDKKTIKEMQKQHAFSVRLKLIVLAISILVAFVTFLVLYYTDSKIGSFSVGFTVFFGLFGLSYIVIGAIVKDMLAYLVGSVSLVVGVIVLMAAVISGIKWFIWLITALVLIAVLVLILLMWVAPKLQIIAKNDDPEYKDYKERRAEKEAQEKTEEEPLPQLKSFKEE